MSVLLKPVRTEPVEVLSFSNPQEGQGFDKLSPNGFHVDVKVTE